MDCRQQESLLLSCNIKNEHATQKSRSDSSTMLTAIPTSYSRDDLSYVSHVLLLRWLLEKSNCNICTHAQTNYLFDYSCVRFKCSGGRQYQQFVATSSTVAHDEERGERRSNEKDGLAHSFSSSLELGFPKRQSRFTRRDEVYSTRPSRQCHASTSGCVCAAARREGLGQQADLLLTVCLYRRSPHQDESSGL